VFMCFLQVGGDGSGEREAVHGEWWVGGAGTSRLRCTYCNR
jgi:hypothetical protein